MLCTDPFRISYFCELLDFFLNDLLFFSAFVKVLFLPFCRDKSHISLKSKAVASSLRHFPDSAASALASPFPSTNRTPVIGNQTWIDGVGSPNGRSWILAQRTIDLFLRSFSFESTD